ncbi:MAG: hypothetical protein LWW81_15895 [Rhodocyclales bacterium]|nr:hypothetical protein [Rhodocyclales bacterium]
MNKHFRITAVLLSLVSPLAAIAAPSSQDVAESYLTSVIKHDQSAAARLVVPGSQADSTWKSHSDAVSRIEKAAPGEAIGFRKKVCYEKDANTSVCTLTLTQGNSDAWLMNVFVRTSDMKVTSATKTTPRMAR